VGYAAKKCSYKPKWAEDLNSGSIHFRIFVKMAWPSLRVLDPTHVVQSRTKASISNDS
jgi:hypothetical protein